MKVSYHKRFSPEGHVYDQAVSMKKSEALHLNLAIEAEIAMGYPRRKEYEDTHKHSQIFLKQIRPKDGIAYMNHTTRRFMELFLLKDVRAKVKDRNTCILIKQS